jgi:hypothetical protein
MALPDCRRWREAAFGCRSAFPGEVFVTGGFREPKPAPPAQKRSIAADAD